jgi:predicted RNA-binding Zn-ribbon protein involved in translation (DUF1610 family)
MFTEELQKLIDAALTDGVLTDKEREVIHKRALLEGVDPDEVDLLLNSEVQKIQQQKQEAVAKVRKCPNCGAIISGMESECPECGYTFIKKAVSSSKELADKLEKLYSTDDVCKAIRNFPVPNNEEDLLEFLITMSSNAKSCSNDNDGDALKASYISKYKECVSKAKILFPNNSKLDVAIKETKSNWWQRRSTTAKVFLCLFGFFFFVFFILPCIISCTSHASLF